MSTLKEPALPLTDRASAQVTTKGFASKRWLYLIPLIFITYSLAYLDRATMALPVRRGSSRTWVSPRACPR